jgi:Txe/YoeB family toxin of Txe-Axe toxin-antitoxin module
MSQVILKTRDIKSLKEVIEKMQQEMKMKDEKMAQFQKENQYLQERVNKLKTRLKGKVILQGTKHVIWYFIVVEAAKFRFYINFINEKYSMAITTRSRCTIVNETLAKKTLEWALNAINLLNSMPNVELQTIGVKLKTGLIIWSRRIIAKHKFLKSVQTKAMQMEQSMQEFKDTFEQLFIKGLPSFWDGKGKLYNQEEYNSLLTQCIMDHSKFEALEENLKGPSLVEYMATDFEILNQFKAVKIGLPNINYATCIDLEILIKHIMDYKIPSNSQWKEIMRLGRTKCSFPGTSK